MVFERDLTGTTILLGLFSRVTWLTFHLHLEWLKLGIQYIVKKIFLFVVLSDVMWPYCSLGFSSFISSICCSLGMLICTEAKGGEFESFRIQPCQEILEIFASAWGRQYFFLFSGGPKILNSGVQYWKFVMIDEIYIAFFS